MKKFQIDSDELYDVEKRYSRANKFSRADKYLPRQEDLAQATVAPKTYDDENNQKLKDSFQDKAVQFSEVIDNYSDRPKSAFDSVDFSKDSVDFSKDSVDFSKRGAYADFDKVDDLSFEEARKRLELSKSPTQPFQSTEHAPQAQQASSFSAPAEQTQNNTPAEQTQVNNRADVKTQVNNRADVKTQVNTRADAKTQNNNRIGEGKKKVGAAYYIFDNKRYYFDGRVEAIDNDDNNGAVKSFNNASNIESPQQGEVSDELKDEPFPEYQTQSVDTNPADAKLGGAVVLSVISVLFGFISLLGGVFILGFLGVGVGIIAYFVKKSALKQGISTNMSGASNVITVLLLIGIMVSAAGSFSIIRT